MKITNCLLISALFISNLIWAQDGKIISKVPLVLHDSTYNQVNKSDTALGLKLRSIDFYRITYLSDGLKVTGYVAEPKEKGKYPCIIANRGGNTNFSQWNPFRIAFYLGRMASWKYVVIASQYRGNDGGEGKEEFGGKDIDDVLNLIPALSQLPNADTSRIGIEGFSRGGMMTYLALKNTCRFKAAAVTGGIANLDFDTTRKWRTKPWELIPGYENNKESVLKARSAIYWADQLCKTTPLLIMQGSADRRTSPGDVLEFVKKLYEYKHPVRFILYEGADHGIEEFPEHFSDIKRHFEYYLRDGNKSPSMEPHGL
ncbi:MAG TPA: prolyl oligopeptidase family serine peptidase [Chitinophagaceae bacterium]|nr:prolyl oligopeptidase family serine peptidase [Chitinophagaceae bacterium]